MQWNALSAGVGSFPGITRVLLNGNYFYGARILLDGLVLRARRSRSLERALDDHILLLAIKARVRIWSSASHGELTSPPRTFEDKLRSAIPEVLEENGVESSQFGLYIRVSVPANYWIGRRLLSPIYTLDSLDAVLNLWRKFREARGELGVGRANLRYCCSPEEATHIWERLRDVYSAAWVQRGTDVRLVNEKLSALEATTAQHRRNHVKHWQNARADREKQLDRAAERRVRFANARRRREEKRERVAMRREDLRRQSAPVIVQLDRLASSWAGELQKIKKQEANFRARVSRRAAAACQREKQARLRALHERRWRWLRRKDLTMEEILRGWPSD
eukprot:TRINITY_DN18425_c0_g1_i1.p1 TRINITY_DN18425_c0_g1~~TRINITY_DN18425_c0_g1_i1.p1  ORF type:complete len:334 (+),score=54.58 TRINITY_DN18425_c0_g1_i1:136-1137(+)